MKVALWGQVGQESRSGQVARVSNGKVGGQISYSRETKDSRPPSLCHQSTATAVFLGLIYTCGHPVTVTAMGQVGRSGRFGLESSKISRLYSQSENLSLRLVFLFVHMTATSLHRNVKCFRFLQHPSSTMTMTVIKHDTWMEF